MRPIIRTHNSLTGEIVDREMNDKEFAAYEKEREIAEARNQAILAEETARKIAKESAIQKLAALGLTEAEIQALAG